MLGSGRTASPIAAALAAIPDATVRICARNIEHGRAAAVAASELSGRLLYARPLCSHAVSDADVIVETIVEDLDVKRALLREVEGWVSADAVIASNTSSLPLDELAGVLERPERFGGLHFLHPAQATAVVEVIAATPSSPETVEALLALVRAMGKRPIVVRKAVPGFVWNRLQFAVLRECLHLLNEGVADVEAIDAAIADGLAPRWLAAGPFATADLGGLETFALVLEQLSPALADDDGPASALLERAASGESFYPWGEERLRQVERLRSDAIGVGRAFAARRAATMDGDGSG